MTELKSRSQERLFSQLVLMLSSTAMQHLGKLINPATGKTEADLEGAQFAIDLLEMLEARTRGNLSDPESRTIREALTALRLNYVETVQQMGKSPTPAEPAPKPAEEPVPAKPEDPKPAGPKTEEPPRFHKAYP